MAQKKTNKTVTPKRLTLPVVFPYLLIIGGVLGLLFSFILSHDTLQIALKPGYAPSCNFNPVLSCGSVIRAEGDTILGLPFPYYGIAAFTAILTAGVGMFAGAVYKRWYWLTFQTFAVLGFAGAIALLLKSMFVIHALCPFCLGVDLIVSILVWYLTLYNIDSGHIKLRSARLKKIYGWIRSHHLDLLVLWVLLVVVFILNHFWYYYGKHLPF